MSDEVPWLETTDFLYEYLAVHQSFRLPAAHYILFSVLTYPNLIRLTSQLARLVVRNNFNIVKTKLFLRVLLHIQIIKRW